MPSRPCWFTRKYGGRKLGLLRGGVDTHQSAAAAVLQGKAAYITINDTFLLCALMIYIATGGEPRGVPLPRKPALPQLACSSVMDIAYEPHTRSWRAGS
jgi:hypothetical protein